jgi:hypothetical protein
MSGTLRLSRRAHIGRMVRIARPDPLVTSRTMGD